MKKEDIKWICTDADEEQFGRQITEKIFEFKQKDVEPTIIDISKYPAKEVESIINSYGYTQMTGDNIADGLNNVVDMYGKQAGWIIAECIFESEI
ncbi:MAG: hypothetical protein V4721_10340 [Bacteroidota bacterium]